MSTVDDPDCLYDGNFLLAVVSQTCFVVANTLMAHYARWIEFLGGNLSQVGYVMGGGAVMGLLLRPWMGQWISRLGARSTWLIGCVVFALSSLANISLSDLSWWIYLFRSGLFLGAAIVFASSLTYISQTAPVARRTEAIGILGTGGFLGMLIGPLLGDLLLGSSGRTHADYSLLFLAAAAANAIAIVLVWALRKPESGFSNPTADPVTFAATIRRHWPGMILLVDLVFGVCMACPFVFVASFIDKAPLQIEGVSIIGMFFWCYAGCGLFVRLSFRRLPDRVGPRRILLAGLAFMSLGMFSFAIVAADTPWLIVVPGVLAGTGHGLTFHTMMSLTIESFPRHVHAIGSTLALMMLDLGTLAGAPVLGHLGERFGFPVLFATTGLLCCVAAGAYAASLLRSTAAPGPEQLPGTDAVRVETGLPITDDSRSRSPQ